ncbi:MAG: helix-turn-helix domain-containing protein [Oscillospiraceae bacterium]|nr:helix-turn-helix domain-containing protein [Oscillospiraceae bacterium]
MYKTDNLMERIKIIAKMRSIALKEVYGLACLNKNVSANLNKGSMLKADNLAKIADVLDCSVDYLLGRTDKLEINR